MTRSTQVNLRLTKDEAKALTAAAKAAGLTLSAWARLVLRQAAGMQGLTQGGEK